MNGPFTKFLYRRLKNLGDITSTTMKAALLRSTGTYTLNPDHAFMADLFSNGAVEISVASYLRQTLGSKTVTQDNANDRAVFDFADIDFGALEVGQTVAAVVFYEHVTNDSDSIPAYFIDGKIKVIANAPALASNFSTVTAATKANPCVITSSAHGLSNGDKVYISGVVGMTQINNLVFTVAGVTTDTFQLSGVNSTGYTTYTSGGNWNMVKTVYVAKLAGSISLGTPITLGSVTGTVRVDAVKGDRILYVSHVSGTIALGDSGVVQTITNLPVALTGTGFNVKLDTAGLLAFPSVTS